MGEDAGVHVWASLASGIACPGERESTGRERVSSGRARGSEHGLRGGRCRWDSERAAEHAYTVVTACAAVTEGAAGRALRE